MVKTPSGSSRQAAAKSASRVLGVISTVHWVSHFHIFVLPMLFPFLKEQLGVGYVELGLSLTVFAIVSGLTQAPIGYLVDHLGARIILLLGMTLGGLALIVLGLHLTYPSLLACAALLGLANSVYHPGNYAILSEHMDEARMGRAYSIHTFAGFLGGAMAPPIIAALVATIGGQGALVVAGAVGPVVAILALLAGTPDAGALRDESGARAPKISVLTPAIIILTVFFTLLSLSTSGINSFTVVALMSGYATSFSTANVALTAFLGASAVGVLAGGYLADRTQRHGHIAAVCFGATTVIVLLIATTTLPAPVLVIAMATAGFLSGVIAPSRDMLVRAAAPPGGAGRAFGLVSTGFNIGGGISPLLYGWIMDQNMPHWVFGISAFFMGLTVVIALVTERRPRHDSINVARATN